MEKWGNTEALKRARKAYEEKVPHGAAVPRTSGTGGAVAGIQVERDPAGQRIGQGSRDTRDSDGAQPRQEMPMKSAMGQDRERGMPVQRDGVDSLAETSNDQKQPQAEQDQVPPTFPAASGVAQLAGTGTGVAFSSSGSMFGGNTGRHAEGRLRACQVQQQIIGEDFLQALWDEFDENSTGGGVLSLGGTAGSGNTSLSCDTSSSSGFFLRSCSYSPRPSKASPSVHRPVSRVDQQKQAVRTFVQEGGLDGVDTSQAGSRDELFGEDYSVLSPSHFFLSPENDDVTGQLLLAGPAESGPQWAQ